MSILVFDSREGQSHGANRRIRIFSSSPANLPPSSSPTNRGKDSKRNRGRFDSLAFRYDSSPSRAVGLAIFSENYTCLKEIEKMYECMKEGNLVVIPIFYKMKPSTVKHLKGEFGDKLVILTKGNEKRKKQCEEALKSIPNLFGITVDDTSDKCQKVNDVVKEVKTVLLTISVILSQNVFVDPSKTTSDAGTVSGGEKNQTFGMDKRIKEFGDMLTGVKYKQTRIISVVGMSGIGKTTLIKKLFKKWERKFSRHTLVDKICVQSNEMGCDSLRTLLLEKLLGLDDPHTENVEDPYEIYMGQLLGRKVLVILDDVNKRHLSSFRKAFQKFGRHFKFFRWVSRIKC